MVDIKQPGLSEEDIETNKETFMRLLTNNITRISAEEVDELIDKLKESDFFTAPASTRYHANYKGGLCEHSLNVYHNLHDLVSLKGYENIISEETITICALLHDISKMNTYEETARNKKVYYEAGSKRDELGHFDWVSEKAWSKKADEQCFIYGNHEETSEFMIRTFIPLSHDESAAILSHHGGIGFDSAQGNTASKVMARYPLASFLHLADMLATYIDEKE